jgi:transketolase
MGDNIATRDAYGNALVEFGKNQQIVVLDADLSKSTKTEKFSKAFPERFFNMGIAEGNLMGTAAGISTCDKIVFASTFAMFASGRAYEQIRNSICYPKLNVKVCATHAGLTVGEDGASHQCIEDLSLMRTIPNMTVISPSDAVTTRLAVKWAIERHGPFYIRLGRMAVPVIHDMNFEMEFGKGIVIKEGKDASIISTGFMVHIALEAAEVLKNQGIHVRVVDMHTIKPIDSALIVDSAKQTGAIVTCEEHNIYGGLGSAVSEVVVQNQPIPMEMVAVEDKFGTSGKPLELIELYGLNIENIVDKVKRVIERKI